MKKRQVISTIVSAMLAISLTACGSSSSSTSNSTSAAPADTAPASADTTAAAEGEPAALENLTMLENYKATDSRIQK